MPTRLNFSLTKEKNAFKNTAVTDIKNNANRSTCLIKKNSGYISGNLSNGTCEKDAVTNTKQNNARKSN